VVHGSPPLPTFLAPHACARPAASSHLLPGSARNPGRRRYAIRWGAPLDDRSALDLIGRRHDPEGAVRGALAMCPGAAAGGPAAPLRHRRRLCADAGRRPRELAQRGPWRALPRSTPLGLKRVDVVASAAARTEGARRQPRRIVSLEKQITDCLPRRIRAARPRARDAPRVTLRPQGGDPHGANDSRGEDETSAAERSVKSAVPLRQ
jgi:hypothetical protein